MKVKAAFAVLWAVLLHLTVALALVSAPPQGQGGPGAGLELRLASGGTPAAQETGAAPAGLLASGSAGTPATIAALPELVPGGAGGDEYLGRVRGRLAAQQSGSVISAAGTVVVRFAIAADGAVYQSAVEHSSGNATLDREALDLLRRASPLPAPPRPLQLSVPIGFRLDQG